MSGPLLDRIDLRVVMGRVPPQVLISGPAGEPSALVAMRIATARTRALARSGVPNSRLTASTVLEACRLEPAAERLLAELSMSAHLTGRGIHRSLRVARTVADLAGHGRVTAGDVAAAVGFREGGVARMIAA